ncbi:G-type lectin S-receptor-like serine/threonine-protein kinase LECRK2 [Camellia lanceoleosa]|uniref:G-type lectin S-receptor-like serine/threonine-protein kinase LECRK2 n=1 Tax=Camellia lanceoleosa TaxID=1840588 RepID=A0ACC0HB54_9ERIC|nr:G-type lectin S-receptor-like serine/threonine-protein kinase LECRK2 [Camellia lanceoleosa]
MLEIIEKNAPTFWSSPSGLFAFGFYTQHISFKVGIWLVGNNGNRTIVWTANRDDPPITSNSTLELIRSRLVPRPEEHHGEEKHIVNTTRSAASASMLDYGNFVLYNDTQQQRSIWQSFDFPTDTILGRQNLSTGMRLTSHLSDTDHSTRQYEIILQADGNLVMYPLNTEESPIDAYYASGTDGYAPLLGTLALINSTSLEAIIELKKATNGFKEELRKGSFGAVYRGTLCRGKKLIAVKRLQKVVEEGEREFQLCIVLSEIVCCRRSMEVNVSTPEEVVLSNWVYKCFAEMELNKLMVVGDEEVDMETLENMVKVGLWCIQDEPALRPSMKSVVLMLAGITDILIRPCPTTY